MEQAVGSEIRDPLIGTVLDERYRVLRRIGRGGMGIVYLAQHVLIGRKYAIKTLSERTNATEEMVARFHREAVAAAAVGSQHVVDVTDMGRLPDGTLYIALEYLEGMELGTVVRTEGAFSVARAVGVACQLCDALAAVHEKGIVHRDLKPENLFLIEQRGVKDFLKVLDFGICKLLETGDASSDPDQVPLTRTNASLGTPQYMAPEQFQTSACVDQRADIHAVGALLYFMLTGKPPFDAATVPQLYMRICVEPPPPLLARRPDVPEPLDRAIRRAMCKHPEDRFSTSAALRAALAPFADAQFDRPSHFEGVGFSSEPAATSSSSSETSRQITPAALETALESELAQLTPRLPERRWRRPFLAVSLVFAGLFSMGWGAWALTPAEKPELARKVSATPRAQQDLPALPAAAAPAALVEEAPATTTHAPQAAKPRVRAQSEARNSEREPIAQQPESAAAPVSARAPEGALRPHVAEPLPEASEPSLPISARAPEGALRPGPANQAADAVFRFPRRALKPVF